MSIILSLLAITLCLIGSIAAWAFVFVYRQPPFHWRTYEAGRHLMRFTFGIALILTWSLFAFLLRYIYQDAGWLLRAIEVGRVFIFGWVVVMLAGRLHLLLKARKAGTIHDNDDVPPDQERREPDPVAEPSSPTE